MTPSLRDFGFRMPAEWEAHEATWLVWPHNRRHWGSRLAAVRRVFRRMIEAISRSEHVYLVVKDRATRDRFLREPCRPSGFAGMVRYFEIPNEDIWVRDYGPIFVKATARGKKRVGCVQWDFNAWGGRYRDLKRDALTGAGIADRPGVPRFEPGVVLEGGAIDVNGLGTCIATEQCLLNPNRNPRLGKKEIEKVLRSYLGIEKVIWLKGGIAGDDTDGHVDEVARFAAPHLILAAFERDSSDENYEVLRENYRRLTLARGSDGRSFRVVSLPMPRARRNAARRLPASYANFYITNRSVLVPAFDDPREAQVFALFRRVFRGRRIVGIRCDDLLRGQGALHCVTQQQPRGES